MLFGMNDMYAQQYSQDRQDDQNNARVDTESSDSREIDYPYLAYSLEKPKVDHRNYGYFVLGNGMKVRCDGCIKGEVSEADNTNNRNYG
jgi:hypothetical protein